jgi:hypothetical protein
MNIDHRPRQPKWSTDLCQCGEDPSTCECSLSVTQTQINTPFQNCVNLAIDVHRSCGAGLITCCLPCITFGRIAEVLDEGQSCKFNHTIRLHVQNGIHATLHIINRHFFFLWYNIKFMLNPNSRS